MAQYNVWEKEYRNPRFMSRDLKAQKFIQRFYKFLKKEGVEVEGSKILDLGSGTARNANYFARLGAKVVAIELSETALAIGKKQAEKENLSVEYIQGSIGEKYNFSDNYFDVVIDATASNSLNEAEREIYLEEVKRVLKPAGIFFVRALCLDGDKNAKKLLKLNPGKEKDTYVMPGVELVERVFSEEDFREIYGSNFEILELEKISGYTSFAGQSYKRNFFISYLRNN